MEASVHAYFLIRHTVHTAGGENSHHLEMNVPTIYIARRGVFTCRECDIAQRATSPSPLPPGFGVSTIKRRAFTQPVGSDEKLSYH